MHSRETGITTAPLNAPIIQANVWHKRDLDAKDWLIPIPKACLEEIEHIVDGLRKSPLPLLTLRAEYFDLPQCVLLMQQVRHQLDGGCGLVVLDRLAIESMNTEESSAVYWVLGQLLGQVVAQKWNGLMIYDVKNTGQEFGYGVRRSVTNLELQFHTDGGFCEIPPEFVGLCCLEQATQGGESRFISLNAVYNQILARHPNLLARLHSPFPWDKQAEHAPDAQKVGWHPIFEQRCGKIFYRYYDGLIHQGYALIEEEIDDEGKRALAVLKDMMEDENLWVQFVIEKGQIQYINNGFFAHSRSQFVDDDTQSGKHRHLLRLWNRREGRPMFHAT